MKQVLKNTTAKQLVEYHKNLGFGHVDLGHGIHVFDKGKEIRIAKETPNGIEMDIKHA